jgi:ATP-binding cassette, subfamily F, member 3
LFATNPDFILIDELTNHLDTESIQVITDWLKDYTGTILLIDHNQEFLEKNVTNYIYIADNLNRELTFYSNKSYSEVINLLSDKEKEDQLKLKNVEKRKLFLEKNLEHLRFRAEVFNANVGTLISNVKKKIKREVDENEIIYNLDLRKQVNFEKNGLNTKIKKNLIFSVKDLKFKIGAKKTQYIEEFKIYKGERVWIQGKNGSGKSTFLKLMQSASNQQLNNEDQYLSGVFSFGDSYDSQKIYSLEQNIKYGLDTTIDKYILLSHKLEFH